MNLTEDFLSSVGYACVEYMEENGGEASYDELRHHVFAMTGFSLTDDDLKSAIRTYEGDDCL